MRLCCKRMRALLKLLAPAGGHSHCMAEERKVRDVARKLSDLRDSDVVRQTIRDLSAKKKAESLKPFAYLLEKGNEKTLLERDDKLQQLLHETAATLGNAAERIEAVTPTARGWPLLAIGLESSYKNAREQYMKTRASADVEAFHDLRKRCKDMLYQVEFVCELWADSLKGLRKLLATAAERLGSSNDLAVSAEELPRVVGEDSAKVLLADAAKYLKKRRQKQAEKALKVGDKLFKLTHREWVTHLEATRWHPAPVAIKDTVGGPVAAKPNVANKPRNAQRPSAKATTAPLIRAKTIKKTPARAPSL